MARTYRKRKRPELLRKRKSPPRKKPKRTKERNATSANNCVTRFDLDALKEFCMAASKYHDLMEHLSSDESNKYYPAYVESSADRHAFMRRTEGFYLDDGGNLRLSKITYYASITKKVFDAETKDKADLPEEQRIYETKAASDVINWRKTGGGSHHNQWEEGEYHQDLSDVAVV